MRHLLIPMTALLLMPTGARAQEARTDTLPSPPDTVFEVEPLVVTASRLPLSATALGQAVTVVEAGPAASASAIDVLRRAGGAFMDEAAGPGGPTIVRLRGGEEVFTQILFDGVQVNQNGGFFDFQGLSLSNLGRVEVARGPQSAVYGSSAVSGVVNLLTPPGREGAPELTLRAEGGGATEHGGSWTGQATLRGGTEALRYSAGAGAAFRRGIYALPHDTETRDASLRLDWAPAPGWTATFSGRRVDVFSYLPVRDPGATRVPLDPNARNERDRSVGSVTLRRTPSGRWSHYLKLYGYREDFVYEDEHDGVTLPESADFFVFDANLRFESALRRWGAEAGGSASASGLRAAWGAQFEHEALEDHITGDFGGDPVLLDRSSVSGFGEVVVTPGASLTLAAGLRAEKYQGLELEATPRASLRWDVDDGVSVRAAVGRAYKAPNLQQQYVDNPFIVANPDLRPERSTSAEAGVDLGDGVNWRASLTLFRQTFEDLIRTVGQEGDSRQINRNLGSSRASGLEWDAALRIRGPWQVETRGAWVTTEILDNQGLSTAEFPVGGELPFRPSVAASATLGYRGPVLDAGLTYRRIGSRTVLSERFSGDRVELGSYGLVGLQASYRIQEGLALYTRLENLLDTRYQTAFDRPGIPATGVVGVDVTF